MIPADIASRLRLATQELPAPPTPVQDSQKLADVLSEFGVGQRIMAEIQTLLPNGTYRAMVGQRDVTLALPFSAKPGDTLELEVTETDGKLSLALVKSSASDTASSTLTDSVSTKLSTAGRVLGDLLAPVDQQGGKAKPAPLNANQPLFAEAPPTGSELASVLKEALAQSGMFYEAHQARWAEGKLPTNQLLQEPQGKLSHPSLIAQATTEQPSAPLAHAGLQGAQDNAALPNSSTPAANGELRASLPHTALPGEITQLVQQQLGALASDTYVWQGQAWPGQSMHWEISEDEGRKRGEIDEQLPQWQTRLNLELPTLGGVQARLRLGLNGQLEISMLTDNPHSQTCLIQAGPDLQAHLESSGLNLSGFNVGIQAPPEEPSGAQDEGNL